MKQRLLDDVPIRRPKRLSLAARVVAALGSVAVAGVIDLLLVSVPGDQIAFFVYSPAIVVAAWVGGLSAGLLATVLSTAAAVAKPGTSSLDAPTLLVGGLFLLSGIVLSLLVESLHALRRRAEDAHGHDRPRTAAVEEPEARFREIADTVPFMVWMVDADGAAQWFNRGWREFRDRSLETERGEAWLAGIHPDDREGFEETVRGAAEDHDSFTAEARLHRGDGEYRWILAHGSPRQVEGRFTGLACSSIDIHDRKELERDRSHLLAEAERAARSKDEFLSILSHELRTPLNAILTWTQLLKNPRARGKIDHGLEVIERNVNLQTELIDELLELSRILSGKLEIESEPVLMDSVFQSALETVRPEVEEKEITVEVDDGAETFVVEGDETQLEKAVSNLLSNAVKFSPEGSRVSLSYTIRGGMAEIRIVDEGKGIEPELLPRIFDRFRQGDSSTRRSHGGLGLGLAIVREIVEAHGGTVTAESDGPGHGATVIVRLPHESPPIAGGDVEAAPAMDLSGIAVLVVDDAPDSLHATAAVLEAAGATVECCSSADEALEILPGKDFDLLVSDIAMPRMNGFELLEEIRALPPTEGGTVPAVALTALARREDRKRARSFGFQAFLPKPVTVDRLIEVVGETVGAHTGPSSEASPGPTGDSGGPARA